MTLRARILLSNMAMVLVPVALVIGLNTVLLSFIQEGSAFGPAWRVSWPWEGAAHVRRPLPTRSMLALTQRTMRRVNVATLTHPDQLASPKFWEEIDESLRDNDAGLVVRDNNSFLFVSRGFTDPIPLGDLPTFGNLQGGLPAGSSLALNYRLLGQWDFPLKDGSNVSVFLLWVTQPWINEVQTFSTILLTGFFTSTLIVGILLTWLIVRRILRPLRQLQDASGKIAAGDLSPSPAYVRRDELAPLFGAFEAMRGRLEENRHIRDRYEADRRDLIAHMAHDLKTPVTAINGYVQGILDGVAATPEKQKQYLQVIAAKARELDRRTDELFFFSSLELGTLPYEFQVFDLGAFLRDLWDDMTLEYGPQGLTGPSPAIPQGDLPARGDPARLRRVFTNLADNTVKFRRGTGVRWEWTVTEGPAGYELTMVDDGVGIGPEALPHVFDQFYREDSSRTSRVPGTGLGLAIVKRIIEDHGGTVRATSGPGPGTKIIVELPKP